MKTIQLSVQGMTCGNCVRHVEQALRSVDGVQDVQVSLPEGLATVTQQESVNPETLITAVEEEGYAAALKSKPEDQ